MLGGVPAPRITLGLDARRVTVERLAGKQQRDSALLRMQRAQLHSARLSAGLSDVTQLLSSLHASIQIRAARGEDVPVRQKEAYQASEVSALRRLLSHPALDLDEESVEALLPLPRSAAFKLHAAMAAAKLLSSGLEFAETEQWYNAETYARELLLERWYQDLDEILALLVVSATEVRLAAQLGVAHLDQA